MSEIDPKLSRLYRAASTEGPPAALDAAILAAARKEVAKPRRPARPSWVRWMAPASALATLVVAVSLAFLVERERPETTGDSAIRQSPPPARATEPSKAKAADSAAPAKAAKPAAPATAAAPAAPAAPAALEKKEAPATLAPAAIAPAQAPLARPAEAAPSAAEAFPAERRAKAAAPGSIAPKAAAESNVAGDSAAGSLGAAAPAAPAAAGRLAPMRQQAAPRSPEAWLEEISRLKREGRDNEAAEQLAEFRKIYPAVSVPESLRGLQ